MTILTMMMTTTTTLNRIERIATVAIIKMKEEISNQLCLNRKANTFEQNGKKNKLYALLLLYFHFKFSMKNTRFYFHFTNVRPQSAVNPNGFVTIFALLDSVYSLSVSVSFMLSSSLFNIFLLFYIRMQHS